MVPYTMNDRLHWAERAQVEKTWQETAAWQARVAGVPLNLDKISVSLTIRPPDRRRRDRHNFNAMFKPIIDGLVRLGVIPDDTPDHLLAEEIVLLKYEEGPRSWSYTLTITEH